MSHSFHQLYYHFAWATDRRLNAISREWRPRLLEIIHEEAERLNSVPLRHNAMPDHVHLLV
ncbi:MAG TPA: transposase, partial [Blastocatellia bacterium]|nr:transposase [Blastocatellia bacterium]